MCNCINITTQSKECYDQQLTVSIPYHMSAYRASRLANGLSDTISIDPCIYGEILQLWQHGVITYGCCCGHNYLTPMVNVADESIDKMLALGYIQEHPDPERKDTFRLKSCGS